MSLDLNHTGPQSDRYDLADLNCGLAEHAADWIPTLFPRGRIVNGTLRVANIDGDPPRNEGSCVIELKGERAANWYDHSTGKGGNPLNTLEHATGLIGRDLLQKAAEIVGSTRKRGRPLKRRTNGHAGPGDHIAEAISIWNGAQAPQGTLTEAYLASRGIPLPLTEDLRHSEITDYATCTLRPAMIARVRRADTGEPTSGVHRTFLTETGHAAREEMRGRHKLALGPIEGGVVMLAPMTPDGRLGVAEGLETAGAMMEINRRATGELFPIWATLGTTGMANFLFPPGLKQLLIFADGGKAGVAAAEKLQGRALAAGIDASYYLPKSGDDFARDLELRLWEQNPGEGESSTSQEKGDAATPEPHPGAPQEPYMNLADGRQMRPPDPITDSPLSVPPRPEGANLEPPPAWSTSAEPIPPQTLEHILAAAGNLTRDVSPEATQRILFILRGVALARLDSIGERQALDAIKTKTRLPIGALRRQLAGFRREMGFADVNKQAWASKLIINEDGRPSAIIANAITALTEDPAFTGAIRYDKLRNETTLCQYVPWDQTCQLSRPWRDQDDREAQVWLQNNNIVVSLEVARDAIQTVAERDPYHPIMNYLNSIHWDGTLRLDTWLIDYLGAEDSEYHRAVGPRWMISGIARIFQPGCQADSALILEGPQGIFKSSVFAVLGDAYYTNDIAALGTKDAQEQIIGVWVVELDELEAVSRAADVASVKSFVSRKFDRFRHAYGRRVEKYLRQCVFGGTVNKTEWHRDETGGRRWWPVGCGTILIDQLRGDRDQLWAEARDRYLAGEKWYLEVPELVEAARIEIEKRYQPDPWEDKIAAYVAILTDVRFGDILGPNCLNIPVDRWSKNDQQRVGAVLRHLGWTRKQARLPGKPQSAPPQWR